MALDGVAAVQAQIQAIKRQITGLAVAPGAVTAGSGSTTGADFASLLSDAMNVKGATAALGGSPDSSGAGATSGGTGTDLSSLLNEARALTGSGGGAPATSPDISSLLASLTGSTSLNGASATTATTTVGAATNYTSSQFVDAALTQQGKPYVWGASASAASASPIAFDCSELTKWAAARAGVTIPDGAAHQYVWLKQQGAAMTVQQALQTPGALLFSFTGEPQPGLTSEPARAHVAISLGNGKTIEARGHAYGVGVFDAANRFDYAGMIPAMT